jgi:hypothetical protein
LSETIDEVERQICERGQELKKMIDCETSRLLQEVGSYKSDLTNHINNFVDGLEKHVSIARNFIKYTDKLKNYGSSVDVAQQASVIQDKAGELSNVDIIQQTAKELGSSKATFSASELSAETSETLIGKVHLPRVKGKQS